MVNSPLLRPYLLGGGWHWEGYLRFPWNQEYDLKKRTAESAGPFCVNTASSMTWQRHIHHTSTFTSYFLSSSHHPPHLKPKCSWDGIFFYTYHKIKPNVSEYSSPKHLEKVPCLKHEHETFFVSRWHSKAKQKRGRETPIYMPPKNRDPWETLWHCCMFVFKTRADTLKFEKKSRCFFWEIRDSFPS